MLCMDTARGLLLPDIAVSDCGGLRRDAGKLGSGVYFAEDPLAALAYTTVSASGRVFLFVAGETCVFACKCVCACLHVCIKYHRA